jgi:hypothetical protein
MRQCRRRKRAKTNDCYGSWPCDNALEGVSAGRGRGVVLCRDRFEQISAVSVWKATWVIMRAILCRSEALQRLTGASQAAIAAISGLMPTMFMTRVRL